MSLLAAIESMRSVESDTHDRPNLCQAACIGACCMQGTVIELLPREAEYLQGKGGDLSPVAKKDWPRRYKPPKGRIPHVLNSDCVNLDPETRMCTDYENRPEVCREFQACDTDTSPCFMQRSAMAGRVTNGVVELGMPLMARFEDMQHNMLQH